MKKMIKNLIADFIIRLSKNSVGRYVYTQIVDNAMSRISTVNHNSHRMTFATPNWLAQYRIDTFATKEPETLEWIDSIPRGSTLWDVGANVGLYAIYAAKARDCKVYAFEPSVFNVELLARNIFLNDLQNQITIVPVALNDSLGVELFKMTNTNWGGALSSFGQNFDQNGGPLKEVFEYQIIGLSMTEATTLLRIPQPDFVKMDVDGIEHYILRGGGNVLSKVKGILVEINDCFEEQIEESVRCLKEAGLTLHKKSVLGHSTCYNQWWVR